MMYSEEGRKNHLKLSSHFTVVSTVLFTESGKNSGKRQRPLQMWVQTRQHGCSSSVCNIMNLWFLLKLRTIPWYWDFLNFAWIFSLPLSSPFLFKFTTMTTLFHFFFFKNLLYLEHLAPWQSQSVCKALYRVCNQQDWVPQTMLVPGRSFPTGLTSITCAKPKGTKNIITIIKFRAGYLLCKIEPLLYITIFQSRMGLHKCRDVIWSCFKHWIMLNCINNLGTNRDHREMTLCMKLNYPGCIWLPW